MRSPNKVTSADGEWRVLFAFLGTMRPVCRKLVRRSEISPEFFGYNHWVQATPGYACVFFLSRRPGAPDPAR
jgi:hypothetical protein